MITITVRKLQDVSINALIDNNRRFTITHTENTEEEAKTNNVADKVALLREQCLRDRK